MPEAQEAGLRIGDKFYPFVSSYTLGEARILKQLTGLTLGEFARRLEEVDEDGTPEVASDPDHLVFLIWVAMHRDNPKITVADVEALDIETTFAGIEGPESESDSKEADAGPPAEDSPAEASGATNEDDPQQEEETAGRSADSAIESEKSSELSLVPTPETSGLPG